MKRIALIALMVLVVVVTAGTVWWHEMNLLPDIAVPMPVMPKPNAFDYFQAASSLDVDQTKVDDAISKVPTKRYSLEDEEAVVRENRKALAKIRQGLQYRYWNPPARSFDATWPYYTRFRRLARLLELEGKVKAAQGDPGGSVGSDLDAVQIGEEIPHGSVVIGMLVGVACQSIGRKPVWNELNQLNARQSLQAVQRLETIQSQHFPRSRTLEEEKWAGQAGLVKVLEEPGYPKPILSLIAQDAGGDEEDNPITIGVRLRAYTTSKTAIINDYTNVLNGLIQNASKPYPLQKFQFTGKTYCTQLLFPVFVDDTREIDGSETQNALLEVMLAIHAYKLEHRSLPHELNDLVPEYISRVPKDPFAINSPLRYKQKGSNFVLYSIGPDGIDNGGVPIERLTNDDGKPITDPSKYFVFDDSKGDIVAGVNIN